MLLHDKAVTGQEGMYASATIDKKTNDLILKVVNMLNKQQQGKFVVEGVKRLQQKGAVAVLQSNNLSQDNFFENPDTIRRSKSR